MGNEIDKVREEIKETARRFILDRERNQGKVLNLKVQAGAGKSHCTTEVINELFPQTPEVVWYGSLHDQFGDLGNLREKNWAQIKGRSRKNGEIPLCKHHVRARELGSRGQPVSIALCKSCRDTRTCDYYPQFSNKGHKFLCHEMLPYYEFADSSIVVIDELDAQCLIDDWRIDSQEITLQIRNGNLEFWEMFQHLINEGKPLSSKALYDRIRNDLGCVNLDELREKIDGLQFNQTSNGKYALELSPHVNMALMLKDLLLDEVHFLNRGEQFNPRVNICPEKHKLKNHSYNEALIRITRKKAIPDWLKDKPLILLGAKGDKQLLSKLLERDESAFIDYNPSIALPNEVEFFKEKSYRFPATTFQNETNFKLVPEQVKEFLSLEKDKKTALICHKAHEKRLAKAFGLQATVQTDSQTQYNDTAHFWGIRGLNCFKDFEQLIVIGTPTPNLDDVVRQCQALYWDEPELKLNTLDNQYVDNRVSSYLKTLREDELYQAVYRIRPLTPNGREKITVIILSSLPVPDIDNQVTQWIQVTAGQKHEIHSRFAEAKKAIYDLLNENESVNYEMFAYCTWAKDINLGDRRKRDIFKDVITKLEVKLISKKPNMYKLSAG